MNFNRHRRFASALRWLTLRAAVLLLTFAAMIGCGRTVDGPPRAAVNGIVSLDGEPLEAGVIRFIPRADTSGPKVSVAIANGFFQLTESDGPVVGQHRIEIEAPAAGELAFDDEEALQRLEQSGRKARIEVVRIPAVYNRSSRLEATISHDAPNDLTFELLSKSK